MKSGDPLTGDHDEGKLLEKFGSFSPFATDSKGKSMGQYKIASDFDRANSQFDRAYAGKTYNTGEYKKTSWWGDRDYVKKVYGGDTDANDLAKTSRFEGSRAGEGSQVSRDSGRNFETGNYATGAAREGGSNRLDRPQDAETAQRREVFTEPDIVPYQQQNGMTMDEMKRALGR